MVVAAFVVSVFALLASFGAVWFARQEVIEARRQTGAADAQAEWARQAYELEKARFEREELERATDRLVRQRVAMKPPVPWHLMPAGKHAVTLSNSSPRKLYDVSLSFDVETPVVEQREWARIDELASVRVVIWRSITASPSEVTVRWRDRADGEFREWTTALPS